MEKARKGREGLITNSEREFVTVGDGEEVFGGDRERHQEALFMVVVVEELKDTLPTIIR